MCALLLGRRGLPILLLEQRSDFRKVTQTDTDRGRIENATKRSINLALSYRGISALKKCGLYAQVEPLLIPMKGRYMHNVGSSKLTFQPYGQGDQVIQSYIITSYIVAHLCDNVICYIGNLLGIAS